MTYQNVTDLCADWFVQVGQLVGNLVKEPVLGPLQFSLLRVQYSTEKCDIMRA